MNITVEKVLNLDFFKKVGFERKGDGIDFLKNHEDLSNTITEKIEELDLYKDQKIEEIQDLFSDYEKEILSYKEDYKNKRKQKKEEKEIMSKQQLKDQLRQEILEEMKQQEEEMKRMKMQVKYSIPEINVSLAKDLKENFFAYAEKMEKDGLDETVVSMYKESQDLLKRLQEINNIIQKQL
jgi:hypothetical protein